MARRDLILTLDLSLRINIAYVHTLSYVVVKPEIILVLYELVKHTTADQMSRIVCLKSMCFTRFSHKITAIYAELS